MGYVSNLAKIAPPYKPREKKRKEKKRKEKKRKEKKKKKRKEKKNSEEEMYSPRKPRCCCQNKEKLLGRQKQKYSNLPFLGIFIEMKAGVT